MLHILASGCIINKLQTWQKKLRGLALCPEAAPERDHVTFLSHSLTCLYRVRVNRKARHSRWHCISYCDSFAWGLPFMTSANFSDFLIPTCPHFHATTLIEVHTVFPCAPSPLECGRHKWRLPYGPLINCPISVTIPKIHFNPSLPGTSR